MKKYMVIFGLLPLLFACNRSKVNDLESQVSTLSQQSADYKKGWDEAQSEVGEYLSSIDSIETNLNAIKDKEGIVSKNLNNEGSISSRRENIVSGINSLNDLIAKNKEMVDDLNKKYKSANVKIKSLDKMIADLNDQIQQKETELASLKSDLDKANMQITNLNTQLNTVTSNNQELTAQNTAQANTIAKQTTDLNTAYYVVGTYKELRDKGVVDKEGGFIGLGKNEALKDDFDPSAFTQVDIRNFTELPINAKDAKVITSHSTSSYNLVEDNKKVEELQITDPQQFWKTSKYLVVLTD